jgi:hypothetical protein
MFVKEHAPHFQITETAAGWAIDAINREGACGRLAVYHTRLHAKAAAADLNKIIFLYAQPQFHVGEQHRSHAPQSLVNDLKIR